MKRIPVFILSAVALLCASCGYHIGGLTNGAMKDVQTFDVSMFENHTNYPYVAMQMTTALTDALQADGTFRLVAPAKSDCCISGKVVSVTPNSLITNPDDSYISTEIGLTVYVDYEVTDRKSGKVLKKGSVRGRGSYFNTGGGNVQAARESALSYATRLAARNVVDELTLP